MKRLATEISMKMCTSKHCSKEHQNVEIHNKQYLPELIEIRDTIRSKNGQMRIKELKDLTERLRAVTKKMSQSKENDAYGRCILHHCESQLRGMIRVVEKDQQEKCATGSKVACDRSKLISNVLKKERLEVTDRDRVFDAFATVASHKVGSIKTTKTPKIRSKSKPK